MFELDLLVRMKILVPEKLNERLENGESEAYLELEDYLRAKLNHGVATTVFGKEVTKLQIEDAGPYNDAGQWEASKFHA
jgi:hypothetical protein